MDLPVPGAERSPQWWLWRGVTLVLWSVALAAIAAYTGEERFTVTLVLIFAAILVAIHAVLFAWGRVRARMGRR
jgi:uncharacterized membrane protein